MSGTNLSSVFEWMYTVGMYLSVLLSFYRASSHSISDVN